VVAKYFPFTVSKAVKGVRMRFDTRRNAVGVILIEQKDPAAAIFETAGSSKRKQIKQQFRTSDALVALDLLGQRCIKRGARLSAKCSQ
jgi:hypothetical protein